MNPSVPKNSRLKIFIHSWSIKKLHALSIILEKVGYSLMKRSFKNDFKLYSVGSYQFEKLDDGKKKNQITTKGIGGGEIRYFTYASCLKIDSKRNFDYDELSSFVK